jgi:hypothetical protein
MSANIAMATKARNAVHLVPRDQFSSRHLPNHTYRALCDALLHAVPAGSVPVTCPKCRAIERAAGSPLRSEP